MEKLTSPKWEKFCKEPGHRTQTTCKRIILLGLMRNTSFRASDTEMLFAPYRLSELGSSLENTAGVIK